MMSIENVERLYAKQRQVKIGADLPEEERVVVSIRPPTLEDFQYLGMKDDESDEEFVRSAAKFLARTTNVDEASILKLSINHLVELLEHVMSGVDIEKLKQLSGGQSQRGAKERLEELRARVAGK